MNDKQYVALWSLFRQQNPAPTELNQVQALAARVGLIPIKIERKSIGRFRTLDAFVVFTKDKEVALPLYDPSTTLQLASGPSIVDRSFWDDVEWFHPAYIMNKYVDVLRRAVHASTVATRSEVFTRELARLYTPIHVASMLLDRYPELPQISRYLDIIREAAEVFYLGRRRAAVASLVPVVEGVLGEMLTILHGPPSVTGRELLKQVVGAEILRATDRLVYHGQWVPNEYRERVFLEVFDEYIMPIRLTHSTTTGSGGGCSRLSLSRTMCASFKALPACGARGS